MSEFINNYINSINVEEEIKKAQANDVVLKSNQNNENQDSEARPEIGKVDTAVDMGVSAAIGAAKGVTYVADLPFYLVQGIETGKDFVFKKTAEALGFSKDETEEIKSDVQIGIENADKMAGEVYNVGSNKMNYSKREVCEMIKAKTGCVVTYNDFDSDKDHRDYVVSYDKINTLGFDTTLTLEDGIDELIRVYEVLNLKDKRHVNAGA